MTPLAWPSETAGAAAPEASLAQAGSNLVLDLHGDPANARLAVLSDGNHHMALVDALEAFARRHPEVGEPFYATTPPRLIAEWIELGAIRIGNLRITVRPHVLVGPPKVLERLAAAGRAGPHAAFARNKGAVLLVRQGNPKNIRGVADLARVDVRFFLSNPVTENVSFSAYLETLDRVGTRAGIKFDFIGQDGSFIRRPRVILGEVIHHREAPQALADGAADCAVVFAHLGLRYTRIFRGEFETIPLGHEPEHVRSDTHVALVGDGGAFGPDFLAFMLGEEAARIYRHHGLESLRAVG